MIYRRPWYYSSDKRTAQKIHTSRPNRQISQLDHIGRNLQDGHFRYRKFQKSGHSSFQDFQNHDPNIIYDPHPGSKNLAKFFPYFRRSRKIFAKFRSFFSFTLLCILQHSLLRFHSTSTNAFRHHLTKLYESFHTHLLRFCSCSRFLPIANAPISQFGIFSDNL